MAFQLRIAAPIIGELVHHLLQGCELGHDLRCQLVDRLITCDGGERGTGERGHDDDHRPAEAAGRASDVGRRPPAEEAYAVQRPGSVEQEEIAGVDEVEADRVAADAEALEPVGDSDRALAAEPRDTG